jgi:ADP-ribose pyrophosphatase YjhB (NUDIX family)
MKLIKVIRDSDVRGGFPDRPVEQERAASRAIVFDGEKKVALLHATKKHYHKLPGGGIEKGETIEAALDRELFEEIGCAVKNVRELGQIEEYRNQWALHQVSYCFLADLNGEKGAPHLEKDEIEDGFEPVWLSLGDAIKILETETDIADYEGRFIQMRDLAFLKAATQI